MVLEATIICIDNSEHMRNGDFSPSRFEAQQDACNLICGKKTSANMENAVGLIATAGKNVEVCVSLTQDLGKILSGLHKVEIGGRSDLVSAIQVASLALRHRQNKRQEQRIVVFVGSPITATEAELKRLGGQLKKNKIAVDIVNFGEGSAEENRAKLEVFHGSVNNNNNSFVVTLPPGEHMLSQMLASTPVVRGADAGPAEAGGAPAAGGGGGGAFEEYGGVDPNVDPELAEALRLSLQSAENERKAREGSSTDAKAPASAPAPAPAAPSGDAMDVDDDEEMRAAIALSLQTVQPDAAAAKPTEEPVDAMDEDDDELAKALAMSKTTSAPTQSTPKDEKSEAKGGDAPVDSNSMAQMLLGLPGMDPNDPEVQELLKQMKNENKDKK